jgi:hypothetical protein
MAPLKLGKLPDRTLARFTFSSWPELTLALEEYAEAYRQTYGQAEPVADLIPYMLEAFLKSDRAFLAARGGAARPQPPDGADGRRAASSPPHNPAA